MKPRGIYKKKKNDLTGDYASKLSELSEKSKGSEEIATVVNRCKVAKGQRNEDENTRER